MDPRLSEIRSKLQIYQEIAQRDYDVPPRQALPVSSRPDIAFRPSCYQLEPIWEPSETAWVWNNEVLYRTPGEALATDEKLAELAAAGVCLIGSNIREIPLVSTDEVFAKFQAAVAASSAELAVQPTVEPGANRWSNQWDLIIWAALPLLAISAVVAFLRHRSGT